jgi:hypothetical protein
VTAATHNASCCAAGNVVVVVAGATVVVVVAGATVVVVVGAAVVVVVAGATVVVGAAVVVVVVGATVVVVGATVVVVGGTVVVVTTVDDLLSAASRQDGSSAIAPIVDNKRTGTTAITERLCAEIFTYRLEAIPAMIRSTATTRSATSLPAAGNLQISVLNTRTPYRLQNVKIVHLANYQGILPFLETGCATPRQIHIER